MTYYYDAAGCRGVSNHGPLNQDWSRGLWSNPQISSVVVNTFFQVSRPRPRPVTDELESSRDSRPWSRDHMTGYYYQCKFITTSLVVLRTNLIIWQRNITSVMPRFDLGMLSVGTGIVMPIELDY